MNGTQTLSRAIDILFILADSGSTLTVSEIAEKVMIPESSAYRFIQTLIKNGFVERKGRGRIGLGMRIFDLARSLAQQIERELLTIARPVMEELTELTGETTVLFVRSGSKAICIESIVSRKLIRLSIDNGRVLPLHSGASGKSLLAYENDKVITEALQLFQTDNERKHVLQQLEQIRREGYSITMGEVDSDVFAIGGPIFDNQQRVVASISVAGPVHRLREEDIPQVVFMVKEAAAGISRKLGDMI